MNLHFGRNVLGPVLSIELCPKSRQKLKYLTIVFKICYI
jgi:hypothetical protein